MTPTTWTPCSDSIETGPWNDGSVATFTPVSNGYHVGYRCEVNGEVSYVTLNPSTGGDSPDVFVYEGGTGDPIEDNPVCYVGFPPLEKG